MAALGRVPEVRRWRCGAVPARLHVFESAGFRVDSCSGEVLRDTFGRPISLDPELAERIAFELWETDSSFPEVLSQLLWSTNRQDTATNLSTVLCFARERFRGCVWHATSKSASD